MLSLVQKLHDSRKALKLSPLARKQGILLKVRDNLQRDVGNAARLVLDRLIRPIRPDGSATEELPKSC